MKLFVAVYTCMRDRAISQHKVENLDRVGCARPYHFYYGTGNGTPGPHENGDPTLPAHVLGCRDNYENLPLKTYGVCKHALETDENWTHLLKTDVNRDIFLIDWDVMRDADYAGMIVPWPGERAYRVGDMSEPLLRAPYLGPLPPCYCGGPAYIISRTLAAMIMIKGAWAARGINAEDEWVGLVAAENGIAPIPAIRYRDDDGLPSNFTLGPRAISK